MRPDETVTPSTRTDSTRTDSTRTDSTRTGDAGEHPDRRAVLERLGAGGLAATALAASVPSEPPPAFTVRRSLERGHAQHGWLDSFHSFSFADYYDPKHMGFRALRVINEDRVAPKGGFPMHPHRDMEILTWLLDGSLAHRDTLGNGGVIKRGEIQWMSAGTGIRHSEFNPSADTAAHFLQIWIQPDAAGQPPAYHQLDLATAVRDQRLTLLAAPDAGDEAIKLRADARIFVARLNKGDTLRWENRAGRHTWMHVATGALALADTALEAGDAVATSAPGHLPLVASEPTEVLFFDLA